MPLFLSFYSEGDKNTYYIAREIILQVRNADVDFIKPIRPFENPKPIFKKQPIFNNVEAGLKLERQPDNGTHLKSKWNLGHYTIKESLRKILRKNDFSEEILNNYKVLLGAGLNNENYYKRFEMLMHCEEHQMELDIRNYDMEVRKCPS